MSLLRNLLFFPQYHSTIHVSAEISHIFSYCNMYRRNKRYHNVIFFQYGAALDASDKSSPKDKARTERGVFRWGPEERSEGWPHEKLRLK